MQGEAARPSHLHSVKNETSTQSSSSGPKRRRVTITRVYEPELLPAEDEDEESAEPLDLAPLPQRVPAHLARRDHHGRTLAERQAEDQAYRAALRKKWRWMLGWSQAGFWGFGLSALGLIYTSLIPMFAGKDAGRIWLPAVGITAGMGVLSVGFTRLMFWLHSRQVPQGMDSDEPALSPEAEDRPTPAP